MNWNDFGKFTWLQAAALEHYFNGPGLEVVQTKVLRFIDDNFVKQGWLGVTFVPWNPVKKKSGRILIKSGALRRSFNSQRMGPGEALFWTNIMYAGIHNQGGDITHYARSETFVRNRYKKGKRGMMFGGMGAFKKGTTPGQGQTYNAYVTKMPRRQFSPTEDSPSPYLDGIIIKQLEKDIKAILTL